MFHFFGLCCHQTIHKIENSYIETFAGTCSCHETKMSSVIANSHSLLTNSWVFGLIVCPPNGIAEYCYNDAPFFSKSCLQGYFSNLHSKHSLFCFLDAVQNSIKWIFFWHSPSKCLQTDFQTYIYLPKCTIFKGSETWCAKRF